MLQGSHVFENSKVNFFTELNYHFPGWKSGQFFPKENLTKLSSICRDALIWCISDVIWKENYGELKFAEYV